MKYIGVDDVTALTSFHLAPLPTRRDIAMLGIVHRAVLRKGPQQFWQHFPTVREGVRQVKEPDFSKGKKLLKRTVLGLVPVYNSLPAEVRAADSTAGFQQRVQQLVKNWAESGTERWHAGLSPRE